MTSRKYFDLQGKHVLITAATTPLARSITSALADAGAMVSLATLTTDEQESSIAKGMLDDCVPAAQRGWVQVVDLLNSTSVNDAVASLEKQRPIDVLVNGVHRADIKPMLESSVDNWHSSIDLNATTAFNASLAVGRSMIERGQRGRIINLISIVHDRGVPNCALFGASQGALLGFTKSLAIEWGRKGINVNAIGIGFIDGIEGPHNDKELNNILQKYIPAARTGNLDDLRGVLVYLASDDAGFVNAELFTVDGAITTHG